MALRSYLLIKLKENTTHEGIVKAVEELEQLDEVTYAEPVVGAWDLLAALETPGAPEDLAARLGKTPAFKETALLKVNPIPSRRRMWRNFKGIPAQPRA